MTDLRDRARDEADLRQRLADLAATITTHTTWDQLHSHIATTPPPRTPRRTLAPTRLRLIAAAAVVVLAAAAIVVTRHHDDGRVRTADTTTTTSASTTTTRPEETATPTAPAPATSVPGTPSPIAREDPAPLIDLPLVLDMLGFGSGGDVTGTGTGEPVPAATTTTTVSATTATTGPTMLPTGVSPDGHPIGVNYPVLENWEPLLTYHQEGDTDVVDVWVNLGPGGVQHLDRIEIPPRPGQNCLILGSTTTPLFDVLPGADPLRVIGGVVTTQASNLFMTAIPPSVGTPGEAGFPIASIEAFPGLDLVLLLVPGDFVRLEARDVDGNLHHTVTAADPDAFPDTC
jgi:hypothetical protein